MQTITIVDTTAPEFVEALPADTTVECSSVPEPVVLTATDNCQDVEVMFEELEEAGDCPNEWTITRTWTVADDCGNANDHTQVLTVVDTTAPELTIPAGLHCRMQRRPPTRRRIGHRQLRRRHH